MPNTDNPHELYCRNFGLPEDPLTLAESLYLSRRNLKETEAERDQLRKERDAAISLAAISGEQASALASEVRELREFADKILAASGGSLDGCDIQDIGVKCGVLEKFTATEPCSESCACAEFEFPLECYRKTTARDAARKEATER